MLNSFVLVWTLPYEVFCFILPCIESNKNAKEKDKSCTWEKVNLPLRYLWILPKYAKSSLLTSVSCVTADSHQKMNTVTTGVTTQIWLFRFFLLTKKCVKSMTILHKIFNKRFICRNFYLIILDTKITIFPRKVRHVLPSWDVWACLAANTFI